MDRIVSYPLFAGVRIRPLRYVLGCLNQHKFAIGVDDPDDDPVNLLTELEKQSHDKPFILYVVVKVEQPVCMLRQ